jgi:hypothetical protein
LGYPHLLALGEEVFFLPLPSVSPPPFLRCRYQQTFAHDERSNMSQSHSPYPLPGGPASTGDPVSDRAAVPRTNPPPPNGHGIPSPLRIAMPADGSLPSFDNVYALAITSALLDQEVLIVCLTDETLAGWRRRLQERDSALEGLTLVDGRSGWSANWRTFFQRRSYDITVLHGIHVALKEQNIPIPYAKRLMDSIPTRLVVLA